MASYSVSQAPSQFSHVTSTFPMGFVVMRHTQPTAGQYHLRPWCERSSTLVLPHSHALTVVPCTPAPVARCSIRLRLAHELAHFAPSSLVVILTRCVDHCRDGWSTIASLIHPRSTSSGHLKTACGLQSSLEGHVEGRLRQCQWPERRDQADR